MDKQQMKQAVCAAIDKRRDEILAIGQDIFSHPELGYKETRTAGIVQRVFDELGFEYQSGLARTGLRTELKGGAEGPKLAVMGELDAVVCPKHPNADPKTGAAHSCGHNGQIAAMLGVAMALHDTDIMRELSGSVALFAIPAEEAVEIEWRKSLMDSGEIRFIGGKQEMIARGCFDDVDLSMMVHQTQGGNIYTGGTCNGFVAKYVHYIGKEAHAGGAPHEGINALSAARLGLAAIDAQRETFRDEDAIRVHPIINKGGDLVNVIPADVRMETYVRGKTMSAVLDAARKVDRALQAGAFAMGAKVDISTLPGYMPRIECPPMDEAFAANAAELVGANRVLKEGHGAGSTDFGDITHIMPGIHCYVGGSEGNAHSSNYRITDPELFYIVSAKVMAMTVIDLLCDGAALARKTLETVEHPYAGKEAYLAAWKELTGI